MPSANNVKTTEDLSGLRVKQFSVFMKNKTGHLLDIIRLLGNHNVHVVALTVVDMVDCGLGRLIVDDPDKTRELFLKHAIAFVESEILVVQLPNSASDLQSVLSILLQAEVNIAFTYTFLTRPMDKAALALQVDQEEYAVQVLTQNQFKVLTQKDISR